MNLSRSVSSDVSTKRESSTAEMRGERPELAARPRRRMWRHIAVLAGLCVVLAPACAHALVSTFFFPFSYQGELLDNGTPVDDTCDFQFTLWDDPDAGNLIGTNIFDGDMGTADPITVVGGRFTTFLNFGVIAVNPVTSYLQIEVCCSTGCSPGLTTLLPRQPLIPAPKAYRATDGVGPLGALDVRSGLVGVGTTSPVSPLTVQGAGNTGPTIGNGWGDFSIGDGVTGLAIGVEPTGSDCCFPHTVTGCDDATCETTVCTLQPTCCDPGGWDTSCAFLANLGCAGICAATPDAGNVRMWTQGNGEVAIGGSQAGDVLTVGPSSVDVAVPLNASSLNVTGNMTSASVFMNGVAGVDGITFPDGTLQTTAGGGGAGDGHSLDAVDGSPIDALFVDASGNVGIGTGGGSGG